METTQKKPMDWKKLLKGTLVTLAIFVVSSLILFVPAMVGEGFSTTDFVLNLLGLIAWLVAFFLIPALIGGFLFVRKGKKGIAWTIGITVAVYVLVIATCVSSLNNMF
ncbi:MAG: hypothetical protein JXK92_08195 [Erysipelotrichaceae bacterium]|nr:hypothetical protein [Erysipelotrichaceae bacterium]